MTVYIFACIKSVQECRCVRVQSSSGIPRTCSHARTIQPSQAESHTTYIHSYIYAGMISRSRLNDDHSRNAGSTLVLAICRILAPCTPCCVSVGRHRSASFSVLSSRYMHTHIDICLCYMHACITLCTRSLASTIFFFPRDKHKREN